MTSLSAVPAATPASSVAGGPAARRHRRLAVRRPRRGDQHDAPADPGARRRGGPPRPQPQRRATIVRAAIQEDADAIAVSSYQGGHNEYFRYMVEMLRERGAGHIRVFGGGGGTITPHGDRRARGATASSGSTTPNDGLALGLTGMIDDLVARAAARARGRPRCRELPDATTITARSREMLSALEDGGDRRRALDERCARAWSAARAPASPVVGITGTGGAGKSTVTDELLRAVPAAVPRPARSRSSPSIRRGGAPAARCSATGSG